MSEELARPNVTNESVGVENVATEEAKIYFVPATETFYTTEVLPYDQIPTPNVLVEKHVYDSLVEQTSTSTEKVIKADAVTGQPRVVNKETLYTIEDHKNFKLQELNLAHRNALEGTIAFKDTAFTLSDSLLFQVTTGLTRILGTQSKMNSIMINAIAYRVSGKISELDISAFTFDEDEYAVTLRDENGRNVLFNSNELNAFVALIQDAYEDAHARLRVLSRAVLVATTLEQVNAISWQGDYSSFLSQEEVQALTTAKTQAEERRRKREEAERRLIELPKELEKMETQRRAEELRRIAAEDAERKKREEEERINQVKEKAIQLSDGTWLKYVRDEQYSSDFSVYRQYSAQDTNPDWYPHSQHFSPVGSRDVDETRRALRYAIEKYGIEHPETQAILTNQFGSNMTYNAARDSFIESNGSFENYDVEWNKDMTFKQYLHKGTFEAFRDPLPSGAPIVDYWTGLSEPVSSNGMLNEHPEDRL